MCRCIQMCPQTCASFEFCWAGLQAFQHPAENVGYAQGSVEPARGRAEGEVRSGPRQRRFLGAKKNFKELNQEPLKSALNSAGPLG